LNLVEKTTLLDLLHDGHRIELLGRQRPHGTSRSAGIGRLVVGTIVVVDHGTGGRADQV
jgi:hypothetical protein